MTIDLILGGLTPSAWAAALAIVFGASIVRGLTGFGFALILVPLLSLIIDPAKAVVLSVLLQTLAGPIGYKQMFAESERETAFPMAIAAMLATAPGVWLLSVTPPDVARLAIALIALGAFGLMFVPAKAGSLPGRTEIWLTGIAAGVLTGFAAMPGPPVVPLYMRRKLSPAVARASMLTVFFAASLAGALASFAMGVASLQLLWLSILFFPVLFIGTKLGELAFGKVSEPVWRTLVGLILGLAGIAAVVRAWN